MLVLFKMQLSHLFLQHISIKTQWFSLDPEKQTQILQINLSFNFSK